MLSFTSSTRMKWLGKDFVAYICSAGLTVLTIIYLVDGFSVLMAPNFGGDLYTLWRERTYLARGVDPYDVSAQGTGQQLAPSEQVRISQHDLAHERKIDPSGYPPWGLGTFFVVIPPGSFRAVQFAFAAECLLSLGLAVGFAYTMARRYGMAAAFLMASSVSAMFANGGTLRLGQVGLILNAFLILYLLALARGWRVASALAMAAAAMKPTFAGLQIVVVALRRQWMQLFAIAAVCLALCAIPSLLTGVGPVELIEQMLGQSPYNTRGDTSLLRVARSIIPYSLAFPLLASAALLGTVAVAYKYRGASILVAMSAAAVFGRVFLYHRQYDNVMLMFPLLTLGLLALQTRNSWVWAAFVGLGISLWLPLHYAFYNAASIITLSAVWLAALAVICWHVRPGPESLGGLHEFGVEGNGDKWRDRDISSVQNSNVDGPRVHGN